MRAAGVATARVQVKLTQEQEFVVGGYTQQEGTQILWLFACRLPQPRRTGEPARYLSRSNRRCSRHPEEKCGDQCPGDRYAFSLEILYTLDSRVLSCDECGPFRTRIDVDRFDGIAVCPPHKAGAPAVEPKSILLLLSSSSALLQT